MRGASWDADIREERDINTQRFEVTISVDLDLVTGIPASCS